MVDPRVTLMGRLVPVEEAKVNICFFFGFILLCSDGSANDYPMTVLSCSAWESLFRLSVFVQIEREGRVHS